MSIAIIPARGGSKRIPKKNIKSFLGKPIISYSIKSAIDSGLFNEIIVSTDSEEIAEVAIKFGAQVPFYRSIENSNDSATTSDVLDEVLRKLTILDQVSKNEPLPVCCLYATAPFITKELLQEAYYKLTKDGLDCVFPIQKFSFPIQRAFVQNTNGLIQWLNPEYALTRSQDLNPCFHDTGQFYFFEARQFLSSKKLISDKSAGILINEWQAHDIDSLEDWKIAEMKYMFLINKGIEA
jgi:pseudaminic acid cytidylyltransferase